MSKLRLQEQQEAVIYVEVGAKQQQTAASCSTRIRTTVVFTAICNDACVVCLHSRLKFTYKQPRKYKKKFEQNLHFVAVCVCI